MAWNQHAWYFQCFCLIMLCTNLKVLGTCSGGGIMFVLDRIVTRHKALWVQLGSGTNTMVEDGIRHKQHLWSRDPAQTTLVKPWSGRNANCEAGIRRKQHVISQNPAQKGFSSMTLVSKCFFEFSKIWIELDILAQPGPFLIPWCLCLS